MEVQVCLYPFSEIFAELLLIDFCPELSGNNDRPDMRLEFANPNQELEAIHVWHDEVKNNEVVGVLFAQLERVGTGGRRCDDVVLEF